MQQGNYKLLPQRQTRKQVLKGIEYNSSTKGKGDNTNEIVTTKSTENCESEKWDTEVEKDKKVSFDNVTNAN